MTLFQGFCAGSYEAHSRLGGVERSINVFPEVIEAGTGKGNKVLYGTPGLLQAYGPVPGNSGPVRGMGHGPAGYFYAAIGDELCRFPSAGGAAVSLGSIVNDSKPVAMEINNHFQTMMVSGGVAYQVIDGVLAPIEALAGVTCRGVVFLDNFFITVVAGTGQFRISGLNDVTSWNPLDFSTAEAYGDSLSQIATHRRELWAFGDGTIEPFYNSGDADFPFKPIRGALIPHGILSPWTVQTLHGGLIWLGSEGRVWYSEAYLPRCISTPAIERLFWDMDFRNAISWTEQHNKHEWYVLSFLNDKCTLVYDFQSGEWFDWLYWDGEEFQAHLGFCHMWNLLGSRNSSIIYAPDMNTYTDAGQPIRRVRRAAHVRGENKRVFYPGFELELERPSAEMTVNLSFSDDGGETFCAPIPKTVPVSGTKSKIEWRNLGSAYDRVYEITTEAPAKIAITEAYLPGVYYK